MNIFSNIFVLMLWISLALMKTQATDYYKTLELRRDATEDEIKRGFRKLSIKYHPDKNPGDEAAAQMFLDVNKAHEVLTDPTKRQIYDLYGEEGLERQAQGGNNPWQQQQGLNKGPNAFADISVTLEELYNGKLKVFPHQKKIYTANADEPFKTETKDLDIQLQVGWKGGPQVFFAKEGDVVPGKIPDDLVIVISEEPHPYFIREGNNLHYTVTVTLLEILTTVPLSITLLNGEKLEQNLEGPFVPDYFHIFPQKGFVSHRDSSKGDLIVHFKLGLWPNELTPEQKQQLESIFKETTFVPLGPPKK